MDEAGYKLIKFSKSEKSLSRIIGNVLVQALPKVIKALTVIGTLALILVAGGIFVHNIEFFHHLVPQVPSIIKEFVIGLVLGFVVLGFVTVIKKLLPKKVSA